MLVDSNGECAISYLFKLVKQLLNHGDDLIYAKYLLTDKTNTDSLESIYTTLDKWMISKGKLNLNEIWTNRNIQRASTLDPHVQNTALCLLIETHYLGISTVITEGYRSFERQDKLYEQGRTTPGRIVTNARGGGSMHNYGMAFDIAFFHDMNTVNHIGDWKTVSAIGKKLGLIWGGDWKKFVDKPHFQSSQCYIRNNTLYYY